MDRRRGETSVRLARRRTFEKTTAVKSPSGSIFATRPKFVVRGVKARPVTTIDVLKLNTMSDYDKELPNDPNCFQFELKERIDEVQWIDKANIRIVISSSFDLKKLRTRLWRHFRVPRDRRIFYIDDDSDGVPIDSECEFQEALRLARWTFYKQNKPLSLIVGSFDMPNYVFLSYSDDEECSETDKICCSNKELKNINDDPSLSCAEKNNGSASELNSELDEQNKKKIKQNDESNKEQRESQDEVKRSDESSEKQRKLEDMEEIPPKMNETLCHLDTMPPSWFTEYMEMMKKDMMSTIIHDVVKNVSDVMNKRLDSFVDPLLKELSQFRSQYSSLPKRHPKYSFDPNEKDQKRIRSQDEEQSSDASIERVDEPQNVNIAEDPQTKKDMISTISQEVVKEMTEMLNRIPLDPLTSVSSKKLGQSRNQLHFSSSKRFARYLNSHSNEKRKMRPQDGEQSSDDASIEGTYEPRNANISSDISRQVQKKLLSKFGKNLIGDARTFGANIIEEKRKKKYHQRASQVITDNLSSEIGKEQSIPNNVQENFTPWKKGPPQVDPVSYDDTVGMIENELRMSCSVTGHQILDENRRRDVCNNLDIDKTSFWSCNQEEEDDYAFEIIQMPASESKDESRSEESTAEQRRHDSNRDSPSFELLSEPPSPTPMCTFMHFNEEHFSANEGNVQPQYLPDYSTNPSTSPIYVIDVHGKVYNEQSADSDECVSADLKKRPGGTYSFIAETLPVQDTRCSKCSDQRLNERKKNSRDDGCDNRDNASSSYDDVRNSHTSYLTVRIHCDSKTQSQCSCQSQTDSNDLTQSFHSHTTSVTDTTDIYTEAYGNNGRCGEKMPTGNDVREAMATATNPRSDHDDNMKETRTNERHCHDADNYSECFYAPHSSTPKNNPVDPSYQSSRASESSDSKSNSNVGSRKTSIGEQQPLGPADPVHILPETLVTAAAQVGSFAYDTAREMFDKIRAHTKEDSVKRRGGVKCDDKKRFFVGPLSLY
ncbi:uncharacterized protein LOC105838434 [Monomorium pharaonis]|uniref:uncharacterized protein LOC105838434 n=1 Tax=Monomorium pharaonis TaxID=307658 RepID=UPI00063F97D3|nr:uncharacterized protein LOC105838434 [Monomorium pharaonis]